MDDRPSGNLDTLLQEPDINESGDNIISFAPGEGNKPLGIFMDRDSEFLSFPTIFCGERRPDNDNRTMPVHYSTVCKWELRNQDRRAAESVPNIFFKLKKLQIKQIQDSASLSLRKCKTKGKKYTAGQIKCQETVDNLVRLDEGFRVFRNLRGSPPYFERCKKDLFAMIRQLGKPTWFCSFSAAETKWVHLLKILGRLVDKKDYTNDEISNMTWQKKSELIQKDPVTCARNFEHMVQLFIHDFMKSSLLPIGEIQDYFYRVEFQQRGSPHIHCLIWIKDAPKYDAMGNNDEVTEFVDKYVTCSNDTSEDMIELMNLQVHKHAKTCKKRGQKICRFNFPLPPMPRSMILQPLPKSAYDENELKIIENNSNAIKCLLENMKYGEDITFKEFLQKLNLNEHEYLDAIKFSLKRDTLLLKRSPSEIRVNSYNTQLLKAWRANMDIQYVLDPYACAVYILSYITKGQRGMSRLLEKACEEARSGDKSIRDRVRHIGNKFLNAVEISAQEAVYLVLQMPLRRASRDFQFINTSNPDERTFLLKSMNKIQDLPDNSVDIESDNIIKRYQRRPRKLEDICLADFVAWYNCVRDNKKTEFLAAKPVNDLQSPCKSDNYLPERDFDDSIDDDDAGDNDTLDDEGYQLKGGMRLVKRKRPKIIRSVRFHREKDSENYFREQLMLYTPWRNEQKDLIKDFNTYEESFEAQKNNITETRNQYEHNSEVLDKAMEDIQECEDEDQDPNVAPNAQHMNEQDRQAEKQASEVHGCFDPGKSKQHSQYDLLDDMGIFPRSNDEEQLVVKRMEDNEFRTLVRSLNRKQREFFYHVLHSVKTKDEQLTLCLTGGAGVGKSTVTNALYEALIKYFNTVPGENPDDIKVLKVAPTGKAAFNIRGNIFILLLRFQPIEGLNIARLIEID